MKKFELPVFEKDDAEENRVLRTRFGDLLETSKLSRLPKLPRPSRPVCENCNALLDFSDEFQLSVKACRKCLATYAAVGSLIEQHTTAKIKRNYSIKGETI